jgi:putative cell wall-binding protein
MDNEQRSSTSPTPSLSDAIDRLLANPELLSTIASAMGMPKKSEDNSEVEKEVNAKAYTSKGNDTSEKDIGEHSDDVSQNKESRIETSAGYDTSRISELVSTLSPLLSSKTSKTDKILPSKETKERDCLLRALKPYVNHDRQEAIEMILRFTQITDIMKYMH